MAIRPKEGRYYKDGLGNVGGPATHNGGKLYPWTIQFKFGSMRQYTCDGKFSTSGQGASDLVSECDKDGNPIKDEAMSDAAQLVMKEGAYYEDGEGDVGGPASLDVDRDDGYFWAVPFPSGPRRYSRKGVCFNKFFQRLDLVREVPTPSAPEAPKPEEGRYYLVAEKAVTRGPAKKDKGDGAVHFDDKHGVTSYTRHGVLQMFIGECDKNGNLLPYGPLEVVDGRFYQDASGRVRGPVMLTGNERFLRVSDQHGDHLFQSNGAFEVLSDPDFNLVREVPAPKPFNTLPRGPRMNGADDQVCCFESSTLLQALNLMIALRGPVAIKFALRNRYGEFSEHTVIPSSLVWVRNGDNENRLCLAGYDVDSRQDKTFEVGLIDIGRVKVMN